MLTAAGNLLYFAATDGEHGVERPAPSNPEQLTAADGTLYFTADDGVHGRELWALPLPR